MNSVIEENFTQTNEGLNGEFNNIEVGCITSKNDAFSLDTEGNLVVNSITTVNGGGQNINFDQIYPIGSLYFNVGEVSPSTLFGGTWEKIEGKFLLASSATYTLGSTGGNSSHTLTVAEMPSHRHDNLEYLFNGNKISLSASGNTGYNLSWNTSGSSDYSDIRTSLTGGGQAFDIMPPYLAINVWKRTA